MSRTVFMFQYKYLGKTFFVLFMRLIFFFLTKLVLRKYKESNLSAHNIYNIVLLCINAFEEFRLHCSYHFIHTHVRVCVVIGTYKHPPRCYLSLVYCRYLITGYTWITLHLWRAGGVFKICSRFFTEDVAQNFIRTLRNTLILTALMRIVVLRQGINKTFRLYRSKT